MKTAISLPDELFHQVDTSARRLRVSRSALIARATSEFLARYADPADATKAWNRAIERGGQPGDDPAARAFRRRSKSVVRPTAGRRR